MFKKCRVCAQVLEVHREEHNGFAVTKSFDGSMFNNRWFCNSCLEEMHIPELFNDILGE